MRKLRLLIDDPDDFFGSLTAENLYEDYPDFTFLLKEGELPPRFPVFRYEELEI